MRCALAIGDRWLRQRLVADHAIDDASRAELPIKGRGAISLIYDDPLAAIAKRRFDARNLLGASRQDHLSADIRYER